MNFKTFKNISNFKLQFRPFADRQLGELVTIGFLMNKTQKENPFIDYLSTAERLASRQVNAPEQDKEAIAALPMDKKVFLVAKYFFNIYMQICKDNETNDQEICFNIVTEALLYKTQRIIPRDELGTIILQANESILSDTLKRRQILMSSQLFDISQRIN